MFNFNGNTPKKINFNGKHVAKVIFNNVVVWLAKVLTTITGYPITLTNSTGEDLVDYKIYGNSVQSRLPEEYQEVEYIESTGTQYIDTGFKSTNLTKVEIAFMYNQVGGFVYGARKSSSSSDSHSFIINENNKVYAQFGYQQQVVTSSYNQVATKYILKNSQDGAYINDELIKQYDNQTFSSNYSVFLFALNQSNNVEKRTFNGKIYYCKMWDSEILIRDFIPCYRKSDNVIGMYDLVSDKFYTNEGTGTFTKGDNVTLTPDTPIEIQSVGEKTKNLLNMGKYTQKVNCGISDTTGEIKYIPGRIVVIDYIEVKSNTNYVFSGKVLNTTYKQLYIYAYDDSKNFIKRIGGGYVDKIKFTTSENCKYIRFYYSEIENLQLEEGSTETAYEQYGYKIPIKVRGKNKISGLTKGIGINSSTGAEIISSTMASSDYIAVDFNVNTNYCISGLPTTLTKYIAAYNANKEFLGRTGAKGASNIILLNSLSFTNNITEAEGDIAYIKVIIYEHQNYTGAIDDIDNCKIQFEEGNTATEYEAYVKPITTNIYLDEPLRKIGDYADYIDFKNQKVVRNVKVVDDTGKLTIEESYQGLSTPTEETIELPTIPTNEGTNIIEVDTIIEPSNMEVEYYSKNI